MIPETEITRITFLTDFNHKMACDFFLHIDLAPRSPLPESDVLKAVIEITAADGSHAPIRVKMIDLCRLELGGIFNLATYASHGMDYYDFYAFFKSKYPQADATTAVAIYSYQKIN